MGPSSFKKTDLFSKKAIFFQNNYKWVLMNSIMVGIEKSVNSISQIEKGIRDTDYKLRNIFEIFPMYNLF